ncbi:MULTISPECIES: fatty acid desaturase family protein [unclassified Mesorhizobium]|uniref:fatty acid desaturase family protein n=1 Tax=unclassified Mesorhizobium TaxID=325217 RepID=UPI001127340D|nr:MULTISPECIES: fatty acid desaturase family protein [unclassified Mesorhizobium]MBZ9957619.1 fatty acid desaturase family protein [Mesorhizobium sp. BR1-1-14]MCA0057006.1 fatty acid desaturase family protein [Mesorhizobium sp. B261B1A]TPK30054.1 fatty acid desaturase [Mesorhizobium sp. B2-5-3]TPK56284.1 fatty acid desaturase [Mesorhizobium sp. B2-5-2]TPL04992.1 fatty acid desaturase [Mesorhizobium sp. B2-4-11]
MDHRDVIASLTNEERSRLTGKSDGPGLVQLAFHLGAILLLGSLIAAKVPFWPLLMLPQGILIVFLFTLLHETVHRTAFERQWLNDAVARVCSLAIALPADWFRYFHFAHHRFTQDPERDPELAFPKPETWRQYLVHVAGLPVWLGHLKTLYANAVGRCQDSYVPPKGRPKVRAEARAMIAFYAVVLMLALWFKATVLLHVWIFPALLGQPFLRLYLLAEHGRCPFVANMLENTRTTLTNWAVRKLAWNMPFHAEHHAYPGVPFHRLPEFHALIERHLKVVEPGYIGFHEKYIETLR